MDSATLLALRKRLDAVAARVAPAEAIVDDGRASAPDLSALRALDRELSRAGVMTRADARLLASLSKTKRRVGALAAGLEQQAACAGDEFEKALVHVERLARRGQLRASVLRALEADFVRLLRIAKVAQVFAGAVDAADAGPRPARTPGRSGPPPEDARVAAASFFQNRAVLNEHDVLRKRRDLELAYELLLRVPPGDDRDLVRTLRTDVAAAKARVNDAPVVRSIPDLVRHVRQVASHAPDAAYEALRSLHERAAESGDEALADVTLQAATSLLPSGEALAAAVDQRSLVYAAQLSSGRATPVAASPGAALSELLLGLDPDSREMRSLEIAAHSHHFFDVEDALAEPLEEISTTAEIARWRRVSYPTQHMVLDTTGSLDELPNFIVQHPKLLLYNLAASQQPVRGYVEREQRPSKKAVRKSAVRALVLDASGSMFGERASFRDSILIAELQAIRARAAAGQRFDPLYFAYFSDRAARLTRVDTAQSAREHMERLLRGGPAHGQTDITRAALAAFESIRDARGVDPYLARATVILVTDGEDSVDVAAIEREQRPIAGMEISISFISLGDVNVDLKRLVATQQAAGIRAFYQHLSDEEISQIPSEFDSMWRTILPASLPESPQNLESLWPHLEALEAIAAARPAPPRPVFTPRLFDARFPEVAQRAPAEVAGQQQFARILSAVADAVSLCPFEDRGAESIALLDHLLGVYGIETRDYMTGVQRPAPSVADALQRVRLIARGVE